MLIENRDPEFRVTITVKFNLWLGHDPNASQMTAFLYACEHGMTGEDIDATLSQEPESIAYKAQPPAPVVPHLEVRGLDLVDATGARQVLCGTDGFLDFFRYRREGPDALIPLLEESQAVGFRMRRVFLQGSQAQNTLFDLNPNEPGYYDDVRPFADLLNRYGQVLNANAYVDNQDVQSGGGHWLTLAAVLRGSGTILAAGNQHQKNGFDPFGLPDPGPGLLWTRGSSVEDTTTAPQGAPLQEFHPRRDLPASLMDAVASPVFIYQQPGSRVPLLITEPPKMGERGSSPAFADPQLCWQFARIYASLCAGAVFHSYDGQRSQLMGPVTRACAEAWVKGMRI